MPTAYEDGVFLNVPFDKKYSRLFDDAGSLNGSDCARSNVLSAC